MTLKPWREIAVPLEDVLRGTFQQAEFAADLSRVHDGTATPEYQNPALLFQRTFITESMRLLLDSVVERVLIRPAFRGLRLGAKLVAALRVRSVISCAFGRRIRDAMLGAKRAVWPSHTSDLQRRSAPEAGGANVQVIAERALMARARQLGYERLILDAVPQTTVAQSLYRSIGFQEIEPYYASPVPGTTFFALSLHQIPGETEPNRQPSAGTELKVNEPVPPTTQGGG